MERFNADVFMRAIRVGNRHKTVQCKSPCSLQSKNSFCRSQLLFSHRRIILEQFLDCLGQVLLLFLRLGLCIKCLTCHPAPNQIMICGIVHVHSQLPYVNSRRRTPCCTHATPGTIPSTAIPARTITPVGTERCELFFLTDARLVSNEKVCAVIVDLSQSLRREFLLDCLSDLFSHQIVGRGCVFDDDPSVRPEFGKVGILVEVVADVLRKSRGGSKQDSQCGGEQNFLHANLQFHEGLVSRSVLAGTYYYARNASSTRRTGITDRPIASSPGGIVVRLLKLTHAMSSHPGIPANDEKDEA